MMCPALPTSESSSLKVWQLSNTRSASAANSSELVYLGGAETELSAGRQQRHNRRARRAHEAYLPSPQQSLPHGGKIHRVFDDTPVATHQPWVHRL